MPSSNDHEKKSKTAPGAAAGFVMERRRFHLAEAELDSSTTSSIKRFQKHISSAIKAGKKNGRAFAICRIAILEIVNLAESSEFNLARSLDSHCKSGIINQLRKADRLFSNMLGEYVVLMPNTPLSDCQGAITRIVEKLADSSFQKGTLTIHPSSKTTFMGWTPEDEVSARELLAGLGYGLGNEEEEESLEAEAEGVVKLFTGEFSDWYSRYELEPDFDAIHSVESSKLDLELHVGRDTWMEGRVVLVRILGDPKGSLNLCAETKHRLLGFLRQVQSLGNATVVSSGLLDFHIHDNRIYLVNAVPEFVDDLTLLNLPVFSALQDEVKEPYSYRYVLLKLCGAIAYLKSLVPPVLLERFSSLIILVAESDEPEGLHLLNHELPTLVRLIAGSLPEANPGGGSCEVKDFLHFARDLTASLKDSAKAGDSKMLDEVCQVEAIVNELLEGEKLGKYNSFSKLKELFKG